MVKKVTIIFGSPSKDSNTHILVKEAQRGLRDSGAESEVFFLNDLRLKGCQSCLACKQKAVTQCAVRDDMQEIYQAMEDSDGILVATPIYFGYPTAQSKLWLDRLFPYLGTREGKREGARANLVGLMPGNKPARFIFTQNQPDPGLFDGAIHQFMHMVGLVGFDVRGHMLAPNLYQGVKPMATERPELLKEAYDLGKNYFK